MHYEAPDEDRMAIIQSHIDTHSDEFKQNSAVYERLIDELLSLIHI